MKRSCVLIIFALLFNIDLNGKSIDAFVQTNIFYTPDAKPYVEIRIFINDKGISRSYAADSSLFFQAAVTILLKKGNDIIRAEKMLLNSPTDRKAGPVIHQLRWPLLIKEGELETSIVDVQDTNNEITLINKIYTADHSQIFLSDIQLSIAAKTSTDTNHMLYKSGFYSEPLIYNLYPKGSNLLYAYFETYGTNNLQNAYLLKFILSRKDSTGIFKIKEEWFKKRPAVPVDPYLLRHDISALISGVYKLTVQLLDGRSKLLNYKEIEFTRENPFWDRIDELSRTHKEDKLFFDTISETMVDYSIRSLYPVISSIDAGVLNNLFKNKKLEEKRIYLFDYWARRSKALLKDARTAFNEHIQLADRVNNMYYSGFGYGFETDRGFIYMKYGVPDEMIIEDKDNGAFPYEIWKYNKIAQTGQTNVKFLFYNPDLAGSDFRLLHSTAHGERQNKQWELALYRNVPDEINGNPVEATEMLPNFNRRAREYFEY